MKTVFYKNNINKTFSTTVKKLKNFINGEFVESKASTYYKIINPASGHVIAEVPETPKSEFDHAIEVAKESYKSWRNVPLLSRQRYMFDFLRLLKDRQVILFLNLIQKKILSK
jgi:malonate-semialdehyde dehydrogenase (acetylating)/methylmalonate-semialdehyde dehydrogenase